MKLRNGKSSGFTLVEFLITMSMMMVVASIGLPALLNFLHRSRVEGSARQAIMMMHASRLEAITRGIPTVVQLDFVNRELVAFADVDGAGSNDPPDGLYNPVGGDAYRETDYELGRFRLPAVVFFKDPDDEYDLLSQDGFDNPVPLPDDVAIFRIDGSVAEAGAFRFADERGNYLESRVAAASTGRVEIRKWDDDESDWLSQGQEGAWKWY